MIEISLQKQLGPFALNIDLQLQFGDFLAIYGPSGAGKTTFLRILAGLVKPDQGHIIVGTKPWVDTNTRINLTPQQRQAGFLFQDYALFPHMTVRENLCFALNKHQGRAIISELIEIIELGDLQHRKPQTLSGGQQQRVALARAIVQKPKLLLLDEPLSALDLEMRKKLQNYLQCIHDEFQLTTILVSHDIAEIFRLANQVLVLESGTIQEIDHPSAVFQNNEVSGKFQFIGEIVALERQDFLYILSILIGKDIVRVIADEQEAIALSIGDQVMVASKAFNPIVQKIALD